jgi:hypothetical protein
LLQNKQEYFYVTKNYATYGYAETTPNQVLFSVSNLIDLLILTPTEESQFDPELANRKMGRGKSGSRSFITREMGDFTAVLST